MQVRDSRVRRGWKRAVIGAVGVLALVCVQAVSAQTPAPGPTTVGNLKERLKVAGGKLDVVVEGIVHSHVDTPDSSNVKGYYLRDVKGDLVLVRTTRDLPFPNTRLTIRGIAMVDREQAFKNTPFILEDTRDVPEPDTLTLTKRADSTVTRTPEYDKGVNAGPTPGGTVVAGEKTGPPPAGGGAGVTVTDPPPPVKDPGLMARLQAMQPATIGLFAVLGVGLIVGAFVLLSRRKPAPATEPWQNPYLSSPPPAVSDPADMLRPTVSAGAPVAGPSPSVNGHQPAVTLEEYKTVKAYKTTKVLPGRLVVLDGGRETDVIHLSDQNGRGEIEIGRDAPDVSGGIRVKDKTNTLSRRQGKLIYDSAKREFTYLNLVGDEGNATVYNGRALRQNEAVVLSSRDVLAMGNVELMFAAK